MYGVKWCLSFPPPLFFIKGVSPPIYKYLCEGGYWRSASQGIRHDGDRICTIILLFILSVLQPLLYCEPSPQFP
jgi:hypothetical protein